MVVPVPGWRQDHVAPLHLDPLTLHGCKPSLAFDDEPHRKSYMSVGFRGLVGHHELQARIQGVGCEGRIYYLVRILWPVIVPQPNISFRREYLLRGSPASTLSFQLDALEQARRLPAG